MGAAETGTAEPLRIEEVDLDRDDHQSAVLMLVNAYACDPMGNHAPLSEEVRNRLIPGLRAHPARHIFLAYRNEAPIGIAVCFLGFSTFNARPLINIHDLAVLPEYRGQGVGRALLAAVEQKARELGCCKLTLEVQEYNRRARGLYEAFGFVQACVDDPAGGALFFTKPV